MWLRGLTDPLNRVEKEEFVKPGFLISRVWLSLHIPVHFASYTSELVEIW